MASPNLNNSGKGPAKKNTIKSQVSPSGNPPHVDELSSPPREVDPSNPLVPPPVPPSPPESPSIKKKSESKAASLKTWAFIGMGCGAGCGNFFGMLFSLLCFYLITADYEFFQRWKPYFFPMAFIGVVGAAVALINAFIIIAIGASFPVVGGGIIGLGVILLISALPSGAFLFVQYYYSTSLYEADPPAAEPSSASRQEEMASVVHYPNGPRPPPPMGTAFTPYPSFPQGYSEPRPPVYQQVT